MENGNNILGAYFMIHDRQSFDAHKRSFKDLLTFDVKKKREFQNIFKIFFFISVWKW